MMETPPGKSNPRRAPEARGVNRAVMAQLIVVRNGSGNQRIELEREPVTLGRARDNRVALPDRAVSRHHAEIALVGEVWTIRDLDSRNGVLINGEAIAGARPLLDGDVITIGETTLRFRNDQEAAPVTLAAEEPEAPAPPPRDEAKGDDRGLIQLPEEPELSPFDEPAPRPGGPMELDWLPLAALTVCWPPDEGPGLHEPPLARETLIHRPVKTHPLLPEHILLMSLARPQLVRHAELLQEVHTAMLGATDPAALFRPILQAILKLTGEPWAAALYPKSEDDPLCLVTEGKASPSARVPLSVLEGAARSGEAVVWIASHGAPESLMPAFFAVPWQASGGTGGLLFGPAAHQTPSDVAPVIGLLAGIGHEIGKWWHALGVHWAGSLPNEATPPLLPPPPL